MYVKTKDIIELFNNYDLVDEDDNELTKEMLKDYDGIIWAFLPAFKYLSSDDTDRQIFTFDFVEKDIWEIKLANDKVDISDDNSDNEPAIVINDSTPLGRKLEKEDDFATFDDLSLLMDNVLKDVKMYQNVLKKKEIESVGEDMKESMQLDEALDTLSNAGYTVTKKNKYNYYPKNTGMSTKQCMKYVLEKHKKALDILKDM